MDLAHGGSGSGDEQNSGSRARNESYHRHSAHQIQQLESFFKECPHPDENQRQQLGQELGLDPKQIKFWFQNKRAQTKFQNEKVSNNALRAENERIHCENLLMQDSLKTVSCPTCNSSSGGEEEKKRNLQTLRIENSRLKAEYERIIGYLANYTGNPSVPSSGNDPFSSFPQKYLPGRGIGVKSTIDLGKMPQVLPKYPVGNSEFNWRAEPSAAHDMDKSVILETAIIAMEELSELFRLKEPVWIKSSANEGYTLHRDSYDKLFPKVNIFKSTTTRLESSKESGEVEMNAMHLIEVFADSIKWKDMFPNIVTKARTIDVIDTKAFGGALYLMYEKMHILSPLVAPREFFFIRYCKQLSLSTWVVVDMSYNFIKELQDAALTRSSKLPSGCLIEDMGNGKSKVTWIEHVQVDDRSLTHRLYRELVCGSQAYGAKTWITTLQRMSERLAFSMRPTTAPPNVLEGVIDSTDGRRNLARLTHRMMKNFCEVLSMSDKLDFPNVAELNNSGVRFSIRRSDVPGQPEGLIISAATSLWLPLSVGDLFNFFKDGDKRSKWDTLSNGNPVSEIARITTGTNPGNCISVIQPFVPKECGIIMLQESAIDSSGGMIIYVPTDLDTIVAVVGGKDVSDIQVLPSGFVISSDGRPIGASNSPNGSLLTVAFQILVSCNAVSKQVDMESVATVHTFISSTIQKMKLALDPSGLIN